MKTLPLILVFGLAFAGLAAGQAPPPVYQAPPPAQPASPPAATPSPPPSSPPQRSAAELEKLLAPIALYPDPLIATMLPASVYPLEVVQAARFVSDTNNLAKIDAQPWDDSVKAVARVPDAIKKLNDDLSWTIALGEAFLAQDKDVMDTIQALRGKAQKAGTLQTTPQQIVVVTNMVIEKTVEQRVVVVTNTVVQIQPSSSSVVYVPAYNPYTVYYPPPAYVYNPMAPLVTFTAGVAMGAIIANNCDWHHGGCYHGDVDVDIDRNVNRNSNRNVNRDTAGGARPSSTSTQKKWQPDQSRMAKSGSPSASASARNSQARGWGSAGAQPSTGGSGARPSTGSAGARPSTGTAGARPSAGTSSASRPAPSTGASRPSPSTSASRASASPSAAPSRSSSSASRPSSSGSAYGGMSSGSSTRSASSRGSSSRSGGFSGGGRSGGASRGGGGGRR